MGIVQKVDRNSFSEPHLNLFWQIMNERQLVWVRRVVEEREPPWTQDAIMREEFVTNVYRELDPGTQYVIKNFLSGKGKSKADRIFNIMVYRLMGSYEPTGDLLGFMKAEEYESDYMMDKLGEAKADADSYIFGHAYRVAAYHDAGGESKLENVSLVMERIAEDLLDEEEGIFAKQEDSKSVRDIYDGLIGVEGFGEFLAYQITLDLLTPNTKGKKLYDFPHDWAMAGPGAKKGIWQLMAPDVRPASMLIVMKWLAANQEEEFERLDLDFPYLLDAEGEERKLTIADMQTWLCEFSKYTRVWQGESNQVRRFKPTSDDLSANTGHISVLDVEEGEELPPSVVTEEPPVAAEEIPTDTEDGDMTPADEPLPVEEEETSTNRISIGKGLVVLSQQQAENITYVLENCTKVVEAHASALVALGVASDASRLLRALAEARETMEDIAPARTRTPNLGEAISSIGAGINAAFSR